VGIVALPLAMAFAIASGVRRGGLFTAIIAGFLISRWAAPTCRSAGRPGAFIVIVYGIVERYGVANLLIATSWRACCCSPWACSAGHAGALHPGAMIIGFTNGIAVLIGLSQFKDFLGLSIAKMPGDFFGSCALWANLHSSTPGLGLAAVSLVIISAGSAMPCWARGRRSRAAQPGAGHHRGAGGGHRGGGRVHLPVETIGSRFGGIPRRCRRSRCPVLLGTVRKLLMPTITIALLGAIESLLCARVADGPPATGTTPTRS
jgi:SulP family sulfate permease